MLSTVRLFCWDKFDETPNEKVMNLSKLTKSYFKRGKEMNEMMENGKLVPLEIVLDLITEAMIAHLKGAKGFLIDGYPRSLEQVRIF